MEIAAIAYMTMIIGSVIGIGLCAAVATVEMTVTTLADWFHNRG